ncbi:phosphatase PAP2 family protein [Hoeflea sp.]|uniref:phosphatase PAP2 family protein n=1 Tax=Hoeflea sp. TaxID=1940281 RepID=UPI003A8FA826
MIAMLKSFGAGVWRRLREDSWFYAVVIGYTAVGLVYLFEFGQLGRTAHADYIEPSFVVFLCWMPATAIMLDAARIVFRFNSRRMLAFKRTFSNARIAALASGLMLMVGVTLFQGTFTSIKISFANIHGGFPYDRYLADLDEFLHFGIAPWRYLYAFAQQPMVRTIVEVNYNVLWHLVCFGSLFFVATSPRADRVRAQYLTMFLFVWIVLGNLLAGLFLSAGPAFYGGVTGDDARFAGMLAFLGQSDWVNSAAMFQYHLWELYKLRRQGIGGGISAFPSVHVGLITMNACFLTSYSRRLGILAFAYVGFVQASSVYLGRHYAVDGYVSIIVVTLAYCLSAKLFRRQAADTRTDKTYTPPSAATV